MSLQIKLTKSSGGGNTDNIKLNHYGPALRWMLYEALQYGVRVELSIKGWSAPEHKPSMTWFWRILEVYPFRRLTYKDADSTERWSDFSSVLYTPHAKLIMCRQAPSSWTPQLRNGVEVTVGHDESLIQVQ